MRFFVKYNGMTGEITSSVMFHTVPDSDSAILETQEFCNSYDITHYVHAGALCKFSEVEVLNKQSLSVGWIWKMPERIVVDTRTLPQAKQQCWEKIKSSRVHAENSPFTFQDILYDANVTNISGASQMALIAQGASQPFSIDWTTYNNSVVTLDGPQMLMLGVTLGSRNSQVYDTARMLRIEIGVATTNTQVDAITWPAT